jgi:hypothetical protein
MEERDPKNRANVLPEIECDSAKPNLRLPNWTEELLTVVKCIETRPPVYLVKYDHGEILKGIFYAEELQKVIKTDNVYKIEPILKKRKMGQRVQYLVKWLGYQESTNSWIFKQDLQKHTPPT